MCYPSPWSHTWEPYLRPGDKVQGGAEAVPERLQNAVKRILTRSLPRLRPIYVSQLQANGVSQVLHELNPVTVALEDMFVDQTCRT